MIVGYDEELDKPTTCACCGELFDLMDGEWYKKNIICPKCCKEKKSEIDIEDEMEELYQIIQDAESTILDAKIRLKELELLK